MTRGNDGAIHAFSNVCRHRAGPVAPGAGHRKALMCGYHGWTYSLEGKLLTTPEWEGVRCFEKDRQNLPAARVETLGPVPLRVPRPEDAAPRGSARLDPEGDRAPAARPT